MLRDRYLLSVGRASPFVLKPTRGSLSAALVIDASSPILAVAIDQPTAAEIDVFSAGRVEISLDSEGASAILIWRVLSAEPCFYFATPLHVGLDDDAEFLGSWLDDLPPGASKTLAIVVQDEAGVVRTMCIINIPALILTQLAPLVERQVAERLDPTCRQRHLASMRDYYLRSGQLEEAFESAPIKAVIV